jgi:hypothetical protein
MDDFLEKLRSDALYIRLVANSKYGGAVDINHITKALSSINISFKNYLEVALRKEFPSTKAVSKEIKKLVQESELLVVDLDFASFKAGISPDIVSLQNTYLSLRQATTLKKQTFKDYKADVFPVNYNSDSFLKKIQEKFTEEERISIYRPVINGLFNQKGIVVYVGTSIDKTERRIKELDDDTVESFTPSFTATSPLKHKDLFYKVYATSSGEIDLFGQKSKLKYLAVEKLDQPTWPYQLKEVSFGSKTVLLNDPLSAEVTFDSDAQNFIISFAPLDITAWGESRQDAEEAFNFSFISLVESILLEKDTNLTSEALTLKKALQRLVKSVS